MSGRKFSTGLDLQGQKAQNAANGAAATDLVTYQQLLALINGLDWHLHVRLAATTNVTLTAPGTTIDGSTPNTGDRILLPNQTTQTQNNIYIYNGASSTMTLAPDAVAGELDVDSTVAVSEGTTYGGKSFTLVTKAPITVGTTALTWGLNNSAVTYTALSGGGLLLDGSNRFSVDRTNVVAKYATTIGDGTTTAFPITHNLSTPVAGDVMIQAYLLSTGEIIEADVSARSATGFTITFGTAPAANSIRVIVQG